MWVKKEVFESLAASLARHTGIVVEMGLERDQLQKVIDIQEREIQRLTEHEKELWGSVVRLTGSVKDIGEQKAKDDISIDWLRNRVNALEKERTILWQRASGIALPTPEIEISKPRTVNQPNFDYMPSFEDPGDEAAKQLGIEHDDAGELIYKK